MSEHYDVLVIGSGEAGKYLAWTLSKDGHRTALVEPKLVGGACPNIACLPSKNIIHSAKVASLAARAAAFRADEITTDMAGVQHRKQTMVEDLVKVHLDAGEAAPRAAGAAGQACRRESPPDGQCPCDRRDQSQSGRRNPCGQISAGNQHQLGPSTGRGSGSSGSTLVSSSSRRFRSGSRITVRRASSIRSNT